MLHSLQRPALRHRRLRDARIAAIALAMWGLWAAACGAAEPAKSPAEALFDAADLAQTSAGLAAGCVEALAFYGTDLSPDARQRLVAAVSAAAVPARARAAQLAAFEAGFDAEHAAAVTAWYASPTGARLLAMEQRAAAADWETALPAYVDRMMQTEPASLRRIEMLKRFARAVRAAEDAATTQNGIDRVLSYAVRALRPSAERPSDVRVAAELRQKYSAALGSLSMQMLVVLQFIYDDASDDELARNVEFAESDAGQWLFATNRAGMRDAVDAIGAALLERLGDPAGWPGVPPPAD